jgi:alkanesulfonate monooxygenase SsuD/methylene tetrahydromethanopterin reductase-like flavin-dependent oxidoreductase (luciferase family)
MTLPFSARLDRSCFLEFCARTEAGPFSTLAYGERIAYPNLDLVTALSAAAVATSRVRIAATVAVVPIHRTIPFAKQIATIDVLSDGRLALGVGVGGRTEDFRAAAASFERRHARLDEQVATMKKVWAGEPPAPKVRPVGPAPVQPGGPPLYCSALGPKALARAARWADGVAGFDVGADVDAMARHFDAARDAWRAAGRQERPFLSTSFWYSLAPDAPEQLRAYAADYLGFLGADLAAAMADLPRVSNEHVLATTLAALADLGADEVILAPVSADPDEISRAAEVVTAAFG